MTVQNWGSQYWHFLHMVSFGYPEMPNEVTKRKYYNLIMDFPLFIPDVQMGKQFAEMLDKYPVKPYLDKRDSFIRWMCFIHNRYNKMLGKREIPILESLDKYLNYLAKTRVPDAEQIEKIYWTDLLIYSILILLLCFAIYYGSTMNK
jgi:hypothetical protein